MNDELLKELINEIKVHNKLLSLYYVHKATGWDVIDDPLHLFKEDNASSNALLEVIKSSLSA